MAYSGELVSFFAHVIFPVHCPVCGRLAVSFCGDCVSKAHKDTLPPFCSECGGAWNAECCYSSAPCYAAAAHDGAARQLLLSLKYGNNRKLGAALGAAMSESFPQIDADIIVPMPLHKKSRRAYNQTQLIAEKIAEQRGIPVEINALQWRSGGGHQTGKNARERGALSFSSFEASDAKIKGKSVILVDDVYTTGATVRTAQFALERAGAKIAAVFLWTRRLRAPDDPEASWPDSEGEDIYGSL